MNPQVLLAVLAVLGVLAAALPRAHIQGECGICTRSFSPQCRCMDASPIGCIPLCKSCVTSIVNDHDIF
ncbi:hypothetical protein ZWY2020_025733 [Hordeum vulgare]|nr:hypothetical protein ZWY2020_025733 [Hordeum vulgare]